MQSNNNFKYTLLNILEFTNLITETLQNIAGVIHKSVKQK